MDIAVMLLQVLIISALRGELFLYICLLIHPILLQPLDISCFAPLYYDQNIKEMTQNDIHAIDKRGFLSIYTTIHACVFSSGFAEADLISFKPERVLAKLHIKMKTSTPLSSSDSNQSFYLGRTSVNLYQLNQQQKQIHDLQRQSLSSVVAEQTLKKIMKGAAIAMQNAVLLQQEVHQLHASNQ